MTASARAEYRQVVVDQIPATEEMIRTCRERLAFLDARKPLDAIDQEIYDMEMAVLEANEQSLVQMRKWEAATV